MPSVYACYRFTVKLRTFGDMLDRCLDRVTASLSAQLPQYGRDIAIDGSDMPAYANGQWFVSKNGRERSDDEFSDQDATWGHRSAVSTRKGGGYYGYKLHMAACTRTGLPVAWAVEMPAPLSYKRVMPLIDTIRARGLAVETAAMDKGYDIRAIYEGCEDRDIRPIIPLKQSPGVKRGDHHTPHCEHGEWTFAGADYSRKAMKFRCPTGECKPASVWIKAERMFPLIPRHTERWSKLSPGRAAVEREFGRIKHDWALASLRVRGLDRVRLRADLTILAKLACALSRALAAPLAA